MKSTRLSFMAALCLASGCTSGADDRTEDAGVDVSPDASPPANPPPPATDMETDGDGVGATDDGEMTDMETDVPDAAAPEDPADGAVANPGDPDESNSGDAASPPPPSDASTAPPSDAGDVDATPPVEPPPPPCDGECTEDEVCNPVTDECVECINDTHCAEEHECRANACEPIVVCEEPSECTDELPVCHSQLDRCVECEIDLDCPEEQTCSGRACVDTSQQCEMGDDPCTAGAILPMMQTQVIDAMGDEFCAMPGFELNFDNAARGNSDLPHRVIARVAWSEQALHLYAEVEDPELVSNPELDYLWSGDVVEVFLATSPASELSGFFSGRIDGVQLVFAPPAGQEPARAARLFWLPSQDNPDSYVQVREPLSTGFAARVTANGYAIEAAVPWSSFGPRTPDVASGLRIAFDFGLSTANEQSINNPNDGRQGAAILYVGESNEGVNTCEGEQLPWCNSTTWCSVELQ